MKKILFFLIYSLFTGLTISSARADLQCDTPFIFTVAGNGNAGLAGMGGLAINASIDKPGSPNGLAFDSKGNLYISLFAGCSILKVDTNGIITTAAGTFSKCGNSGDGGPATQALIENGYGFSFDPFGNLYFSTSNGTIRKIDTNGIISTVAGVWGKTGFAGDGGPATQALIDGFYKRLVFDQKGNIYFNDDNWTRIRKIDILSGIITTIAGDGQSHSSGDRGPATQAGLDNAVDIAFDNQKNLYIATRFRIRKIDVKGIITTVAGNGQFGYSGDGGPADQAIIAFPIQLIFDNQQNLLFAGSDNRVRKVDANHIITTVAGNGQFGYSGDGGPAIQATLILSEIPLAVDNLGNLYIQDRDNTSTIRKVDTKGIITTVAGTGNPGAYSGDGIPANKSNLNHPQPIIFDKNNDLYIGDYNNHRVRKVTCEIACLPGNACNDNNNCTTIDTCDNNGKCAGSPIVCSAIDQCHDVGTCNIKTGICSNPPKADGSACNDGDVCTQDMCQKGICKGTIVNTDNDDVPDCKDPCPNDPNKNDKTGPGVCGCNAIEFDFNKNGIIDKNDCRPFFEIPRKFPNNYPLKLTPPDIWGPKGPWWKGNIKTIKPVDTNIKTVQPVKTTTTPLKKETTSTSAPKSLTTVPSTNETLAH